MAPPVILHATTVAFRNSGGWRGVLISGPSGVGKSDLALRLTERGWRLVTDDRTLVWTSGARLFGRAPDALFGLVEARGLGVISTAALRVAPITAAVACAEDGTEVERMPEPDELTVLSFGLPLLHLRAREASAPAKLARFVAGRPL